MVDVEQWAEIRRMHFVAGVSIKEIARRTGRDRNTVRRALRSSGPPAYRRAPSPSKLEPFKEEIHRLLREDPRLPGQWIRELIEPLGYAGGKTILDDYLREIRPLLSRRRGCFNGRSNGRARSASSICGSRPGRSRSGTASSVAAGWSWHAWAIRAPAPGR